MTTGYSGTPLPARLGIKAGMRVALVGAPAGFEDRLEPTAEYSRRGSGAVDMAIVFATQMVVLQRRFQGAVDRLPPEGSLWIAWPKKASGVATDITENRLRDEFLPTGWVDVKVIAIDSTWSGLKFVLRRALR